MKKKSSKKLTTQEPTKSDMTDKKLEELKEKLRNQKSILKKILKMLDNKKENKY